MVHKFNNVEDNVKLMKKETWDIKKNLYKWKFIFNFLERWLY